MNENESGPTYLPHLPAGPALVEEALTSARQRHTDQMFITLGRIPAEQLPQYLWLTEQMFAQSAVAAVGPEATLDQLSRVGGILERDSQSLITPTPYLFERLLRRAYGEPDITSGVAMDEALVHYLVGSVLMRTDQPDEMVGQALAALNSGALPEQWA